VDKVNHAYIGYAPIKDIKWEKVGATNKNGVEDDCHVGVTSRILDKKRGRGLTEKEKEKIDDHFVGDYYSWAWWCNDDHVHIIETYKNPKIDGYIYRTAEYHEGAEKENIICFSCGSKAKVVRIDGEYKGWDAACIGVNCGDWGENHPLEPLYWADGTRKKLKFVKNGGIPIIKCIRFPLFLDNPKIDHHYNEEE